MSETEYKPDWVSPPGDTIKDIMKERGLSFDDLYAQLGMGVSEEEVQKVLDGMTPLSEKMMMKLSIATGTSVEFWVNRDRHYWESMAERAVNPEPINEWVIYAIQDKFQDAKKEIEVARRKIADIKHELTSAEAKLEGLFGKLQAFALFLEQALENDGDYTQEVEEIKKK